MGYTNKADSSFGYDAKFGTDNGILTENSESFKWFANCASKYLTKTSTWFVTSDSNDAIELFKKKFGDHRVVSFHGIPTNSAFPTWKFSEESQLKIWMVFIYLFLLLLLLLLLLV